MPDDVLTFAPSRSKDVEVRSVQYKSCRKSSEVTGIWNAAEPSDLNGYRHHLCDTSDRQIARNIESCRILHSDGCAFEGHVWMFAGMKEIAALQGFVACFPLGINTGNIGLNENM